MVTLCCCIHERHAIGERASAPDRFRCPAVHRRRASDQRGGGSPVAVSIAVNDKLGLRKRPAHGTAVADEQAGSNTSVHAVFASRRTQPARGSNMQKPSRPWFVKRLQNGRHARTVLAAKVNRASACSASPMAPRWMMDRSACSAGKNRDHMPSIKNTPWATTHQLRCLSA